MGQTLSSPATTKTSETGQSGRFAYAVTEMQGWRITMEDAHAIVLDLEENSGPNTFFAVYDGHGGSTVAKFAGLNVHKRLLNEESYKAKNYEESLKRAFLGTDEDMLGNPAHSRDPSGCTAVAALVTDDKIYVANAGDSRSVLSIKGEVKPLSFDHKPTNDVERTRIAGAGGYIEYGRVNGNLALSRALGDFEFKKNYSLSPEKQIITADPDVTCHEITEEDEFLVLACDGIWDCLTSQQVVNFIRYQVSEGKELSEIGEMMCDHCLAPDTSSGAGIGCDNMTVLIVAILHGRTKEEWYSWVTDRVKKNYGYATPNTLPQLYAQSRLMSFRARREAQEARERARQEMDDTHTNGYLTSSAFGTFARVLGSTGGISYHPGAGIITDGGLMFGTDDSDEEEDDDEENSATGAVSYFEPTKNLKAQLAEFERDIQEEDGLDDDLDAPIADHFETSDDMDGMEDPTLVSHSEGSSSLPSKQETPPPPNLRVNGDVHHVEQLKSTPGGDEPSPAVKVEGLMDTSEDPFKV
ncbi:PP2C-domain-containing protein [Armillaria luteobubalina]|uniref:protein-serine/threonine phosphatase n=1 Tax=Armillaria luteobubalina TaxID=153913 RepID=A0AA39UUI5_9AGAR|nr:PP2C-domain-containing protein [Armillaria luteobubalina]